jgi:hypothetical protein
LGNLTRAYEVALTNKDDQAAGQFANIIASHGYLQDPTQRKARTVTRTIGGRVFLVDLDSGEKQDLGPAPVTGRSGGASVPAEDRLATQLRSHYQRLLGRKSRTGAPLYTEATAMDAAIALMGVNATPAVIARVRATPGATPATGSLAERNRRRAALNLPPVTQ